MRLYVPYTRINATQRFVVWPLEPLYVEMAGDDGYPDYLAERWRDGEGFVNLEHDVIPWPGAVEEIMGCPEPWCAYSYSQHPRPNETPMLGLVKFSADFIAATPGLWDPPWTFSDDFKVYWGTKGLPRTWQHCDTYMKARDLPGERHLHTPAVINANGI